MNVVEQAVWNNDQKDAKDRKSNVALAEQLGTSEASIRRARKRIAANATTNHNPNHSANKRQPQPQPSNLRIEGDKDGFEFSGLDSPNALDPGDKGAFAKIFDLAGLNEDEYSLDSDSFRFSTWQQSAFNDKTGARDLVQLYSYKGRFTRNAAENDRLLAYEDLADVIRRYTPRTNSPRKPHSKPGTPVLCLSDLQIGKAMEHGGGTRETIAVVQQSVSAFIDQYCGGMVEAVLVDGGDMIENMFNTPTQAYTNDLDVAAQIRTARRLMLDTILRVLEHVERVTYVSIPSNHGQVRSGQKAQAGTVEADFGLEIGYQLEDAIALNPELAYRVTFVRPDALEETAVLHTSDTVLAFNHGHRMGAQTKHSDWWGKQDHGRMPGWDADILVTAHYHTLSVQQSGDARWIIGTSSPEPGSGWFALSTGKRSLRGCTAFLVDRGMWEQLAVV